MAVGDFIDEITPVEHFFVRSHTLAPDVKLPDWSLKIGGLVDKPVTLTLADLKKLPRVEMVSVLECAGNGRSFYKPRVAGAQWQFGSVGNARWTGARLADVLKLAGLKPAATQLLMDGADKPMGTMPKFQRTLEVKKALDPDTMLAWDMNGQPLTTEHGFPLRLIAPGWASDSWVKWLTSLEAMDHEFDGFWMKTAYRHPNHHVEPGSAVDAKDMIPVTDLNVKSVIATPDAWAKPGSIVVQGVAWSNASPVTKVELSLDGGKSWVATKLGGRATKYGFRKWSYTWKAGEGEYTLMSKATNAAGQTQPMEPEWNPNGYLYNAAQPRALAVAAKAPPVMTTHDALAPAEPAGYKAGCFACHDDNMMRQQHLTRAQWDREVTKMTNWGAQVKAGDREGLLDYLAARFR
jgi:DMSO/TMAO reductase YedYZ molybdopterin-dependent catalytic subunit